MGAGGGGTAGWQAGGILQKAEGTARPQALPARGSPWFFLKPGIFEATAWTTWPSVPKAEKAEKSTTRPSPHTFSCGLGFYRRLDGGTPEVPGRQPGAESQMSRH